MSAVTITVLDALDADFPVPNVIASVFDESDDEFIDFGRTNGAGVVRFDLDPGTYLLRLFREGFIGSEEDLVVLFGGGSFVFNVASVTTAPSPSPLTCRLYADFVSQEGVPYEKFKLQVQVIFDPLGTQGYALVDQARNYETDSSGHVEFEIVRGARVRIVFVTVPLAREIVVPDKSVESLLQVLGTTTDAFKIVKR